LTGGVLSGSLGIGGAGAYYTVVPVANRNQIAFGWFGTYANLFVDGSSQGAIATREFLAGNYLPLSGGNLGGSISVIGNIQASQAFWVTSNGAKFYSNAGVTLLTFSDANWRLAQTNTTGQLQYIRGYDGVSLFSFGGDGTNVFAGTLKVNGALETDGAFFARGGEIFMGAGDHSKWISDNSTYTILQMVNNALWQTDWSTASIYWKVNNNNFFSIRATDGQIGNNLGPIFGLGAYNNISDERTKAKMWSASDGLDEIMQLKPIMFNRKFDGRDEAGFSAQQLQQIMPHAVMNVGEGEEILSVALDPIVVALVNGMKELATRMSALENKS
jgi:hypothetical protein